MKNENSDLGTSEVPGGRITRARAAAFRASGAVLPLKPPIAKPEKKQLPRVKKTKRDENSYAAPTASFQNKKRAVLRDITNNCREKSLKDCSNAAKAQIKGCQKVRAGPSKVEICPHMKAAESSDWVPAVSAVSESVLHDKKTEQVQEMTLLESQDSSLSFILKENIPVPQDSESLLDGEITCDTVLFEKHAIRKEPELICSTQHVKDEFCKDAGALSIDFVDIDSDHSNPQMCCLYSSDIYTNLRAAELLRRPLANFMETVQRDITHSMRGILIDWLVEVSDEYNLVPDTLHLTVNMIDRFLSQIYIERQRLQLLGITCMLIASKYEEICAPRVEEFCFITDNTYTKAEVLNMEIQVLNFLGFHLSVPTTKTFLRRFIRAAHTAYKVPPQALSHLANYFAELTLVEYSFLKFLPSAIAASAVFLARWTLEQSDHPWNQTLEHYTSYKSSEIKMTVLAMHDLQMNSNNSYLNAIREKYKQPKFESVSAMTSPELLQSLFS